MTPTLDDLHDDAARLMSPDPTAVAAQPDVALTYEQLRDLHADANWQCSVLSGAVDDLHRELADAKQRIGALEAGLREVTDSAGEVEGCFNIHCKVPYAAIAAARALLEAADAT